MSEFQKRYLSLNDKQREAVDTIDGPVMVVAGPGTGKTELLSVRVANILNKTDALPGNVLCLTFTDSGAIAMRDRLSKLLGADAYKVVIHTFHSFGTEVINQSGEYFYSGANFRPADELSSYKILSAIIEKLPHDNPLSSTMNGQFTYLRDIKTAIAELKRGGLTPDELGKILERNAKFCEWIQPKIQQAFGDRISNKTIDLARALVDELESYNDEPLEIPGYHSLSSVISASLQNATEEAESIGKPKPLTAWKGNYLEKNASGEMALKDTKRGEKLSALSKIYFDYLNSMQQNELFDYDDMILRVVHALENFDDLRYNLQEQYQYILVDEFQDTNDAQMRLVWNLTNNPASEGRPNIMVVGDDDQAIYRFQGAELSNILDFTSRYRNVKVITLTDNYRSTGKILSLAREVITQAEERLENSLENVSKILTPHHENTNSKISAETYETTVESYVKLAENIINESANNPKQNRAVIARHHKELVALLPHLNAKGIAVKYERQENILDDEPIKLIEQTARVIWHITREEFDEANENLAQVLAHPAWNLPAKEVWTLSMTAYRQKKFWLEVMLDDEQFKAIAEWFIVGSAHARHEPLEYMLDYIFGIQEVDGFSSPYKSYFFGQPENISTAYLTYLSSLQKIRSSIREYRPGTILKIDDFIEYLDLHRQLNLSLSSNTKIDTGSTAVTLLSAHKAKGLEFDTVYLIDAQESVWGSSARSRGRLISFPANMTLSPVGDSDDERLRLLYVALTRARNQLKIISARTNDNGKEMVPVGAFSDGNLNFIDKPAFDTPEAVESLEESWYTPILDISEDDKKSLLKPLLENYRLSATHLNNYLDVTRGGPEYFLLRNLLRIPEAMSPSAAYGSAMHASLQRAHQHLAAHKNRRPVEDILHDFETTLAQSQLSEQDRVNFTERGIKALTTFFDQRYDSFKPTQQVERSFSGDRVLVSDAVINGALDLIDIDHDEKTIFVTDYKTGKAASSWKGKTDYEKIKLHHYEQQLMMYKLLIENSRQFHKYTVTGARIEFVEPDAAGNIVLLDYSYDEEKLADFRKLVSAVWDRIHSLDFAAVTEYDANISGIINFENSLLNS